MGNDFWISLSFVILYAAEVADILISRWGIWNGKLKEGNRFARWFTKNAVGTFCDGVVKLFLVVIAAVAFKHIGWADTKHASIPLAAAGFSIYHVVKNLILIRKAPATK